MVPKTNIFCTPQQFVDQLLPIVEHQGNFNVCSGNLTIIPVVAHCSLIKAYAILVKKKKIINSI